MERSLIKKAFLIAFMSLVFLGISGQKIWGLSAYEQSLIQRVEQAFSKEKGMIPSDSLWHPVCATPLTMEIRLNWDKMSSEAKKILSPLIERPDYSPHTEYTYDSPSGHFKIHYTITGDAAVYRADEDVNQDGIPDYVNQCGLILDHVWSKEVDSLGYYAPPSDADYPPEMDNGGDGRYDVYLDYFDPHFFGASYPEYQVESEKPIYTSYLELRNDYSFWVDPIYHNVYEPLMVTVAHEFFHAIHFGYDATEMEIGPPPDNFPEAYWMEISAVWMEDMVYDNIDDYLGYLPYFYGEPWLSLRTFRNPYDYHPYASCVWAFFLQENYGIDIIKKIWEKCAEVPGDNALQAMDEILHESPYNTSLEDAFREFTVWNYFIGDRAIPEVFYSEGDLFVDKDDNPLEMKVEWTHTQYPVTSFSPQDRPQDLGSNYVVFKPYADSIGGLSMNFVGLDSESWKVSVVAYVEGFLPLTFGMDLDELQTGNGKVYNWSDYSEIILIPCVASKGGEVSSYDYDCSADYDTSLYGPQLFPPWLTVDPRGPKTAYTRKTLNFDLIATDQNPEDILKITKDGVGNFNFTPSVSPAIGNFSWTPSSGDVVNSPYLVVFSVTDGEGGYDTTIVEIEVLEWSDKDIFPQNFPNPFVIAENSFTYFPIVLSEESDVEISITTVAGEKIKSLKKRLGMGTYTYESKHLLPRWDGKNEKGEYVTSGVYLYHVQTKNSSVLKKMVVVR